MTTIEDVLANRARWCVEHSRCEAFSLALPDGSVNLLWLDPPYFRVVDEEWDRAWKTEADFLAWLRGVVREAARVLAPNGSLYLFASPQMGGRVECIARELLDVLNHLVWAKPERSFAEKYGVENFRQFVPMSERVIFAEHRGADSVALGESGYAAKCDEARGFVFEPLRAYLADEVKASGHTRETVNVALGFARGGMAGHYFSRSQWQLPTAKHYAAMQRLVGPLHLRRQYDDLRRPFAAPNGFTDVWTYATAPSTSSRHPCEKPEAMLRDVVRCSSRPGDVVCEFFGGSFRMAEVALSEGRRYIGCDADEHWARVGVERARAAERGTVAAVPSRRAKATRDEALPLFGGVR